MGFDQFVPVSQNTLFKPTHTLSLSLSRSLVQNTHANTHECVSCTHTGTRMHTQVGKVADVGRTEGRHWSRMGGGGTDPTGQRRAPTLRQVTLSGARV